MKLFDYVDPKNRETQREMEKEVTLHLRKIGALVKPGGEPVNLDEGEFPVTASIIIPVRNRAKTIGDAVSSALRQQASFRFNVIVVDNHSTDGTTDILGTFASRDPRLIHIVPEADGLEIGGGWNESAARTDRAGRYRLEGLPPGAYQVAIKAPGFRRAAYLDWGSPRTVDIEGGFPGGGQLRGC